MGRGHPHPYPTHASGPPPKGLRFRRKGTLRGSGGRGPRPRCSRVGQLLVEGCWGGRGTRPHPLNFLFSLPCVFSPPKRKIMVFETLSGGHFGEDAIFLCHVMLFPHLISATLSQQSTVPPSAFPPRPPPTSFLAPLFQDLGLNG